LVLKASGCGLCCVPAGATLLSFVVALVHFLTELLVFKTMSIKGAATPMIIAGKLPCELHAICGF
jgi:hypothetical protein